MSLRAQKALKDSQEGQRHSGGQRTSTNSTVANQATDLNPKGHPFLMFTGVSCPTDNARM